MPGPVPNETLVTASSNSSFFPVHAYEYLMATVIITSNMQCILHNRSESQWSSTLSGSHIIPPRQSSPLLGEAGRCKLRLLGCMDADFPLNSLLMNKLKLRGSSSLRSRNISKLPFSGYNVPWAHPNTSGEEPVQCMSEKSSC